MRLFALLYVPFVPDIGSFSSIESIHTLVEVIYSVIVILLFCVSQTYLDLLLLVEVAEKDVRQIEQNFAYILPN